MTLSLSGSVVRPGEWPFNLKIGREYCVISKEKVGFKHKSPPPSPKSGRFLSAAKPYTKSPISTPFLFQRRRRDMEEEQQNQEHGIQQQIEETMRSRLLHFKDQAE